MNFKTNIIIYDASKENLHKLLQNFFKDYKKEYNKPLIRKIPAKLALLMNDKELKAVVTSKKIDYHIECYSSQETIELRNRINKL